MGKLQKEMNRKKNNGITLIAFAISTKCLRYV